MSRKGRRRKRQRAFHRRTGPGAAPGRIVSDPHSLQCRIKVFSYGPEELVERELTDPLQLREFVGRRHVTWINVDGLGDAGVIQQLGDLFGLHPLALEDVIHVHQRAKVEDYGRQLFIVGRMVRFHTDMAGDSGDAPVEANSGPQRSLESEQISLFLGKDFVITFQEDALEDCFDPVRARLRLISLGGGLGGADSLAHALLDAVTDSYFPVIESYSDELDRLDDELAETPRSATLHRIHEIRSELLTLRRTAWPLREAFQNLIRENHPLISADTRIYLRDCYDHTVQIIDVLETYRELCADLREYYFSAISQRTNDIMKVLTIIATIFIPLSFVAGVYGMNFDTSASPWNMPELKWAFGYPFAWGVMGLMAGGLLYYVWRKGWLHK